MAIRICIFFALVAFANAGFPLGYGAPAYAAPAYAGHAYAAPAITSEHSNTLRSFGNLGQVSTFSKTIDTPFSSVRKSDVRVSNPGYAAAPYAYGHGLAAPAYAAPAYASPLAHGYAGPAYAAPAIIPKVVGAPALLGVAYSAAPAVAHMTYSNGLGFNYAW